MNVTGRRVCGRWIRLCSASISGSVSANVTAIFHVYIHFQVNKDIRCCLQEWFPIDAISGGGGELYRWHHRHRSVIGQIRNRCHPLHPPRQTIFFWKLRHPREIAPHCVSIFSQSSRERSRRGLCRTRRCYGWRRTARQHWTRTADLDSATGVGWVPVSGPCSPVTLYHPWVCSAPRRTTWAKVKKKKKRS